MDGQRWKQIKAIFNEVLQKAPGERAAFLVQACGDDPEIRAEVESLLAAHDTTLDFLEPPEGTGLLAKHQDEKLVGTRVGQFLLQRIISSGGMGTVYEALQENPNRQVAVKVMREGLTSPSAIRRFEYESQILARLSHPNIAQVIEAGASEGMPYFVMEYVPEARSITGYAAEKNLKTGERLALFTQVCKAVHHGHQKGVIHRDLKPSNILVDPAGQVKIIDFGVARATDADLRLTTIGTDIGQLIGTVQYMSPEQCKADPAELDTRSDVYALGMVLYKLLCGELPYVVQQTAIFEAVRVIREQDPKRPSAVHKTLRGDVENIILKALEKPPGRRYQTVADFGIDIERHLRGEVVLARPVGLTTRTWKFIKRNPKLSTAGGVAFIALISFFLYVVLWSYPQIRDERNNALIAQDTAIREMKKATKMHEFFEEILRQADPFMAGREIELSDMLNYAIRKIDRDFRAEPEIEASLRFTIGTTYFHLAAYDVAEAQLDRSLELLTRLYGEEYWETLYARCWLGLVYREQSRFEEAEQALTQSLEINRKRMGEDHTVTLFALREVGTFYNQRGRYHEAEKVLREALQASNRVLGESDRNSMVCAHRLANTLRQLENLDEAEEIYRKGIALRTRLLGEKHLETNYINRSLADLLDVRGRLSEAEALYRKVLEVFEAVLGETHPSTLAVMSNIATIYREKGQLAEAERLIRDILEKNKDLAEDHPLALAHKNSLANLLKGQGKYAEAEAMHRRILALRKQVIGATHPNTLDSQNNLANVCSRMGKLEEAETLQREVYEIRLDHLGADHSDTLAIMNNLAITLSRQLKHDESCALNRQVLTSRERVLGEEHFDTLMSMNNLCIDCRNVNLLEESEAIARRGLEICRRVYGNKSGLVTDLLYNLGITLDQLGRYPEAVGFHEEALALREKIYHSTHPHILYSLNRLGNLYFKQQMHAEAVQATKGYLQIIKQTRGEEHPDTLQVIRILSYRIMHLGAYQEAVDLIEKTLPTADRVLPEHDSGRAFLRNFLGNCLFRLGRYEEGALFLEEAYDWFLAHESKASTGAQDTVGALIQLNERWGKPEEAAHWRENIVE